MKHIIFKCDWSMEREDAFDEISKEIQSLLLGDTVAIDLSQVTKINAGNLSVLAFLVHLCYEMTMKQLDIINGTEEVMKQLCGSGFFELGLVKKRCFFSEKDSYLEKKIIPIRRYRGESGLQTVATRCDLIRFGDTREASNMLYAVRNIIGELAGNCCIHSTDPNREAYYYVYGEVDGEKVRIMVMDFGMGFYNSLCMYADIVDATSALRNVIQNGYSCKGADGGMGIRAVKRIVNQYRGSFWICSGDAMAHYTNKSIEKMVRLKNQMIGSCVFVELNCVGA